MRRVTALSAAAGLAVSAFAIASPVQAANPAQAANDYYLIRWDNTGACQVWNERLTPPIKWPSDYKVMSHPIPTFAEALTLKEQLRAKGDCKY
jgi:hypothetical protein